MSIEKNVKRKQYPFNKNIHFCFLIFGLTSIHSHHISNPYIFISSFFARCFVIGLFPMRLSELSYWVTANYRINWRRLTGTMASL
jgi:hypothetical protein